MLHLVAFPPWNTARCDALAAALADGDQVVFIEQGGLFLDGTLGSGAALALLQGAAEVAWHVERSVAPSGGMQVGDVVVIDWAEIVALTEAHTPCLSWY